MNHLGQGASTTHPGFLGDNQPSFPEGKKAVSIILGTRALAILHKHKILKGVSHYVCTSAGYVSREV